MVAVPRTDKILSIVVMPNPEDDLFEDPCTGQQFFVEDNTHSINGDVKRLYIPALLLATELTVLPNLVGDFDDDDDVDTDDICLLQQEIFIEGTDLTFDVDANGVVEFEDLELMIEVILMTRFGDANLDLKVDAQDLNINGLNWQQSPRCWKEGNFSVDDTIVDAQDLNKIGLNWGWDGN